MDSRLVLVLGRLAQRSRRRPVRSPRVQAGPGWVAAVTAELGIDIRDVFVMPGRGAIRTANKLAAALPEANIHVLTTRPLPPDRLSKLAQKVDHRTCRTDEERLATLARLPQPQLIVDTAKIAQPRTRRLFSDSFRFLQAGGAYVIQRRGNEPAPDQWAEFARALADIARAQSRSRTRGRGPARVQQPTERPRVTVQEELILVRQDLEHRYKIRDRDANEMLDARFGKRWGRVVTVKPAATYTSRATVTVCGTRDAWRGELAEPTTHGTIDVPGRSLRQYNDVRCWSHQRLALDNYWLPDTFRHHLHPNLSHRSLTSSGRTHARLPPDAMRNPRHVEGACFYLDSEFPGHFGHFLTEVLSRFWGWQAAVRIEPDLRPLVSLPRNATTVPTYQQRIYEALEVDTRSIEYVAANECVRVDSLYASTPDFVMPHYAAPELSDIWSRISGALVRPRSNPPRRLFVTRRPRGIRSCLNTDEVEAFFADLGFSVVDPEEHEFADQVSLFAHAEVIAGFAGSGLFNMMFAPNATVILICAESYTATNEYLIASITGARLHYFLAAAETKHPAGAWSWAAYQSNFRFDLHRHGPEIRSLVRG